MISWSCPLETDDSCPPRYFTSSSENNKSLMLSTHYCRVSFQLETAWGALAAIVQLKKGLPLLACVENWNHPPVFFIGIQRDSTDNGINRIFRHYTRILRTSMYVTATASGREPLLQQDRNFVCLLTDDCCQSLCWWLSCKAIQRNVSVWVMKTYFICLSMEDLADRQ